ncbi:response regulator [Endothiovibrio diazotrophicus]
MTEPDPTKNNHKTILCIDDEPNVLAAVRRVLRPLAFEVITVTSGTEALEVARLVPPDLVILDLFMPEMDGYETLKGLRALGLEEVPVVMLTGDPDILRGYAEGATYYIPKPFHNEYLLNIVEYLIGDPSPERRTWLEVNL